MIQIAIPQVFAFHTHFFLEGKKVLRVELTPSSSRASFWSVTADSEGVNIIQHWCEAYFHGVNLYEFEIPSKILQQVCRIPFGKTMSYKEIAQSVGNEKACRGVARACAANRALLLIPCHRVINSNGLLGGYSRGIDIKKELITFEKRFLFKNN
jgi:O-6-methylguanine DNA methyltransferase